MKKRQQTAGGEDGAPRADPSPRHPIAVVSARTGLTPDVLRVWERRYGVTTPGRSPAGRRLYTDADVERLSLLRRATLGGRSVGQVARLSLSELAALVAEDEGARAPVRAAPPASAEAAEQAAGEALELALALQPAALQQRLRRALAEVGAGAFLVGVLAPLFRRLGDGWHAGAVSPAQEHLATAVARRVLDDCLTLLAPPPGAPALVVATPAGDRHELGALLVAAAAAEAGWFVIYLGADLPAEAVAEVARRSSARAVALSAVYVAPGAPLPGYMAALRSALPSEVAVLVGGAAAQAHRRELGAAGVSVLVELGALREALERVGAGAART